MMRLRSDAVIASIECASHGRPAHRVPTRIMGMAVAPSPGNPVTTYRVLILTGAPPATVARLIARIHTDAPHVAVCGVLYEQRRPKTLTRRVRDFIGSASDATFRAYALARIRRALGRAAFAGADAVLRFAHASRRHPNGAAGFGLDDLNRCCAQADIPIAITDDIHSTDSLRFARRRRADLGVVYGTRILKPSLYGIPRNGSINIHKRRVPEYRGGGPIGLWELLDNAADIGITVHRVAERVDAGAVVAATTIPIHQFDSLRSLELKADAVGDDLLVEAITAFAAGVVREMPQPSAGRTFKTPSPPQLHRLEQQLAAVRPPYRAARGRPAAKLLARTLVGAPYVIARNWIRRWRRSFPVVILYHHLVTDREHCDGIPTEAFADQVAYLRKHYRIVTMRAAIELLEAGAVDQPTLVLTFDDGYADNFLGLRAVLEDARVPATLFVSTQVIEEGRLFAHDVSSNQLDFIPLTPRQVVQLRRCCEIGSHTRSHFDCGSHDAAALDHEIVGSKQDLERWLQEPIEYFSFPWGRAGRMSPAAVRLAKTTYPFVFSAFGGQNFARAGGAPWHLRRSVHPNDLWELELQLQAILEFGAPEIDIDLQTPVEVA
jgi:peptidoglycan/xylan/chitin deacetylase (PgdA/CDA1 family)